MFITVAQLKDIKLHEDVLINNSIASLTYRLIKRYDVITDDLQVKLSDIFEYDKSLRFFYAIARELPNYNDVWEKLAMWNWYSVKDKSTEMDNKIRTPAQVMEIIKNIESNNLDKTGYDSSDYVSFTKMFYASGSDVNKFLEHAFICGICAFADKLPFRTIDMDKALQYEARIVAKIEELLIAGNNPEDGVSHVTI